MTKSITVSDVSKQYAKNNASLDVFDGLSFSIEPQTFVVIVGPSGCGKTTLLKMIAGIEEPTEGQIQIANSPISGPNDDIAMVFQDFQLLPWKSVQKNVEVALEVQEGLDPETRADRARTWLRRVGLEDFADSYPRELSGGMKQRVGLARALAVDPTILLMDEPFGSLDAQTRDRLQSELLELWGDQRKTILFVTHDIDEAIFLADRVLVLSPKPASIVGEISIDIERPRYNRRLAVEQSEEFSQAKRYLRERLGL